MNDHSSDKWDLAKNYFKPLIPFLKDPDVSDIIVNGASDIFVTKKGSTFKADAFFADERTLETAIIQVGNVVGEDVDPDSSPILDTTLWDKSRLNAVLYPYSKKGTSVSIRVYNSEFLQIEDLLRFGSLTEDMAQYLKMAVISKANILISGSVNSGKTTLLNALTKDIPDDERLITVEDTAEIRTDVSNHVALVVSDGRATSAKTKMTLATMIKTTLRMNGSRIIVGEIRDSEAALAFMRALNVGTEGCATSLHANNAADAVERLVELLSEKGIPFEQGRRMVYSNVHIVVQAARVGKNKKKIVSISELSRDGVKDLFVYDYLQDNHIQNNEHFNNSIVRQNAIKKNRI